MTEPTGWPHMLPCPFCGGDARHDVHADDCYFILHHKFKNSGADMSLAFEVVAAWNRRTPQPTQAQAGAVPLTDEQLAEMMRETWGCASIAPRHAIGFARAIERAHGIGIKGGQHGAKN